MKIISLFLIGILVTVPFFVQTHDAKKDQPGWESAPKKNGPVIRFIQKYPIIVAVLVGIPLFFILYKWREALVANVELNKNNESCIWREQHLILQLLAAESKAEERENFIKTTIKEMSERFHSLATPTPLAISSTTTPVVTTQ